MNSITFGILFIDLKYYNEKVHKSLPLPSLLHIYKFSKGNYMTACLSNISKDSPNGEGTKVVSLLFMGELVL